MHEFELIHFIAEKFADLMPRETTGIGDDCAIIPAENGLVWVITTDILMDGVHFLHDKITPEQLGAKALNVSLSDVAAMGAVPVASFLSIALPETATRSWCERFFEGYHSASKQADTPLLGGDTSRSARDMAINVLVIGKAPVENLKRRCNGRVGDMLYVSGSLGDSGAGLRLLTVPYAEARQADKEALTAAHHAPQPELALGAWLANRPEVGAMMDLSDGLGSDLHHILDASHTGAEVDIARLPLSEALQRTCDVNGWDARELALCGGEDYKLLFSVRCEACRQFESDAREQGFTLTSIGKLTPTVGELIWVENGRKCPRDFMGFRHF